VTELPYIEAYDGELRQGAVLIVPPGGHVAVSNRVKMMGSPELKMR